jgi:hypothetical protein
MGFQPDAPEDVIQMLGKAGAELHANDMHHTTHCIWPAAKAEREPSRLFWPVVPV